MKRPSEADFELQLLESGVNVFFKPTKSHYSFVRLAGEHVSRFGELSRDAFKLASRLAAASGRR